MGNSEVKTLLNSWMKNLQNSKSLSLNTVKSYASDLKLLLRFLEEYRGESISIEHIKKLEKNDVRSWILRRKGEGESARTISRGLAALKSFLKYLVEVKIIDGSDILTMKSPKIEKTLPRPLSIEQINDVLHAVSDMKQTPWIIKRDKALLILIYSVGLRISEALSLNKSDIINSSGSIKVIGKGGKARMIPLLDKIKNVALDYIQECKFPETEALFVNKNGDRLSPCAIQKLVRKARKTLNLSDSVTPHALRHSCATHLMESSGDLRSIQELLGHSSISSTQIYADVAQKYISDAYDRCHPLSKKKSVKNDK
ncbi:MAG: tyrosine recombinase XerC [Holosporales bacterium]|jgi:integrase/recombinase XerC|nr:tyrosine recombinase XerC [Holosporales bacterium]